jgi:hypothetical protein
MQEREDYDRRLEEEKNKEFADVDKKIKIY